MPRHCYDTCGVTVHKRNGAIDSVRGHPAHFVSQGQLVSGALSVTTMNRWDPRSRLTQPLRRAGRKGEGRFERLSWKTAIDAIADRLKRIVAIAGPQAILGSHYAARSRSSCIGFRRVSSTAWRDRGQPRHAPEHGRLCRPHQTHGPQSAGFDSVDRRERHLHHRVGCESFSFDLGRAAAWLAKLRRLWSRPGAGPHGAVRISICNRSLQRRGPGLSTLDVIQREQPVHRNFVAQHPWPGRRDRRSRNAPAVGQAQTGVPAHRSRSSWPAHPQQRRPAAIQARDILDQVRRHASLRLAPLRRALREHRFTASHPTVCCATKLRSTSCSRWMTWSIEKARAASLPGTVADGYPPPRPSGSAPGR